MRSRTLQAVLLLLGLGVILYVVMSLFIASPNRLIFGINRSNGSIRLARNGVTFLPPHEFRRMAFAMRDGAALSQGVVRIRSREGVPVRISYRVHFKISGRPLPAVDTIVDKGWDAWVADRVSEAIRAVTERTPIDDFISPTAAFGPRRKLVRETVTRHLSRSGLDVTGFEIEGIEVDRDALLKAKLAELRREERGKWGRVAVFAIDGMDWNLVDELVDDGRIPNIAALIDGGSTALVQSVHPTIAPLTWTTMATGVPPYRHGVLDFFDRQNRNLPVTSLARQAPAVWEIAAGFQRPSLVVNWWTDWPPLTDSAMVASTPLGPEDPEDVFPAGLEPLAAKAQIPEATVGWEQMHRFLNINQNEFQKAVGTGNPQDPIVRFRSVLAKTWSDDRLALEIYRKEKPQLMMLGFEGADIVDHLFGAYHPPYREDVSWEDYRRFWPAVGNYYAEIDRMLGEWLKVLPEDTTVMLVSSYGTRWGKNRPKTPSGAGEGLALHDDQGLLIAYGNRVPASRPMHSISVYDIAPSILALLGLPPSDEMKGSVATSVFENLRPVETVRVSSYSDLIRLYPTMVGGKVDPSVYHAVLEASGHLGGEAAQPRMTREPETPAEHQRLTGEQWRVYAVTNNRGAELAAKGQKTEAIDQFEKAAALNPERATPLLNLAMIALQSQRYVSAETLMFQALEKNPSNPDQLLVDMAAWFRAHDMISWAIRVLGKGKEQYPESYLIASELGASLAEAGRYTEGLQELDRALALQPLSTSVLNNLGIIYAKKKDYARALDYWNRSLTIAPRQPKIAEAARAATTNL